MKYSRRFQKSMHSTTLFVFFFLNSPTHSMFDPKNWVTSSLKINFVLLFILDIYKTTWYFRDNLKRKAENIKKFMTMLSFKQVESNHHGKFSHCLNFGYRKCYYYFFNSNSKWLHMPHASKKIFEQHLTLF